MIIMVEIGAFFWIRGTKPNTVRLLDKHSNDWTLADIQAAIGSSLPASYSAAEDAKRAMARLWPEQEQSK